ncbi:hypothetical protein L7F22_066378 [Adiantum nelumboides]|nr:hypothetical protein [Adiantum nelumboides]
MKLARLARRFSSSSLASLSAPGQQSVLRKEHSFAQKELSVFAVLSGDSNPIHTDPSAAQSAGFSACVVHGMLCASLCSSLISSRFPGAFYESKTLRFKEPALVGDCIEAEVKILSTVPATGGLRQPLYLFISRLGAILLRASPFQDVHAQWKATTTSPSKPDKQYSEKELEEELEARLAYIFDVHKKDRKHGKKRRKSTDVPGYRGRQSRFDKAKKHKKCVRFAEVSSSSSSSSDSSSDSSEEDRKGKKRSKKQRHRKGKKKARKSKSRRMDDSSTEDTSTDSSDFEDGALSRKPQVSAVSISYHNELEEMKGQCAEDEDFARIYDQIINGQRHEHYTLKSDFLMIHGKVCVTKQLRPKVLIECHAPPYAGHRGIDATVKIAVRGDVDAFLRSCLVCQKVKFDRQKAPGLLQPLPIPDKPWENIAMDFIFYLPRTPTE